MSDVLHSVDRKSGHVCPPSNATHPSNRWESLFVYAFICKFTSLRAKVEGLESPMDLEDALMSREPNPILSAILVCFVLNLKPQTRNISMDQISSTVASVLGEYFKTSERTVFWNEDYRMNIDPFNSLEGGFFTADWDFKLKILRQLVELQLVHSADIKARIDRAWGVSQSKGKKKDPPANLKDSSEADTYQDLHFIPLGQDIDRKRYWVVDDSPRIYISTNPWKTTSTFQKISSTHDEYIAAVEMLKASSPPPPQGRARRNKMQQAHVNLIKALEERIPAIEAELARVQRVKRKIDQKRALMAQAELRETRTRRQARRPDYVYAVDDVDSEDDAEYTFQEEGDDDFEEEVDSMADDLPNGARKRRGAASSVGTRRSTRSTVVNANKQKREVEEDPWSQWRGERRSARLGAPPELQLDQEPPRKRARTEESSISTGSLEPPPPSDHNGLRLKSSSAAALKPNEVAMEQVAGKKRSKFWVYAVEPAPTNGSALTGMNGHTAAHRDDYHSSTHNEPENLSAEYERSTAGSLSPLHSG